MRWIRDDRRITLRESMRFHGHLGPYLMLGILMGEYALENLKAEKYSGLEVKIKGADKKPKSCLIDGLQLSTGCTFGKGNIKKLNGKDIQAFFYNINNKKGIALRLRDGLGLRLRKLKTHRDSETLAREIYKTNYNKLFNLTKWRYPD